MILLQRGSAPEFLTIERPSLLDMLWDLVAGHDDERAAYISVDQIVDDVVHAPELAEALSTTFHGKCAFCESPVDSAIDVGHIRPIGNTINFRGEHFPRHYFWLALEWSNLVLACRPCSQSRGNRFPLEDEAQRANVPDGPHVDATTIEAAIAAEAPRLLDPTRDDPRQHLDFATTTGWVEPLSERGGVSIELFNLNREELVAARREAIESLDQELAAIELLTEADAERLSGDAVPFAAIRRQHIETWAQSHRVDSELASRIEPVSFSVTPQAETRAASFSLDADDYYRQSRKIEKVVLKNFRSIEDLTLHMASGDAEEAGWTMILGENGTGKSTMLQGMALALAGAEYREQLSRDRGLDARAFVRRVARGPSPDQGSVEVYLSGVPDPATLRVDRGAAAFSGTAEARVLLLGYGSTRLLPRGGDAPQIGAELARVDNLFDPFVPLGNARRWLSSLPAEAFEPLAAALGELLDLGADVELRQNLDGQRIDVRMYDTIVPLEQLSDGYQSVIALTADIMSILRQRWGSMAVAEGVVLLDELGAHLHPKWRMGIVRSLRKTFPRVQFIVTTHDPLCLRGLRSGEVIVMGRDHEQRVVARTDLPPIEGLRIDQLLTSEHFGLSTTLEPDVERDFARYYQLLAEPSLDADEARRLKALEARFDQRHLLGETRRERILLAAIDRHLANEAGLTDAAARRQSQEQLDQLLDDTLAALEV